LTIDNFYTNALKEKYSMSNPIEIERIQCGIDNCFLLSQGENSILVDTARAKYREKILERCKGKNVRLIVLTHGHYDHTMNAAWLSEKLGVPVAMHEADLPVLGDILHDPIITTDFTSFMLIAMVKLSRRRAFRWFLAPFFDPETPPFEPGVLLEDGFSLAGYGVEATVITLPGHSRGSVGIVAGEHLLVGDAMSNLFYPSKSALYVDAEATARSAAKLAAYGTHMTLHLGHGNPMQNREQW